MKIAALVKQVPMFEAMELGPDGRLVREGLELELNPYCRRAVSKGVELAGGHRRHLHGHHPRATFGGGRACAKRSRGERTAACSSPMPLSRDPTRSQRRALAAVLEREGPFDLLLAGRNSVDADTGQVGPEVAELLDLPFVTGVKRLDLGEGQLKVCVKRTTARASALCSFRQSSRRPNA